MAFENSITLTDSAARQIFSLIQEAEDLELKLRIFINGGGCSGFQYNFVFDKEIQSDDQVIEKTLDDSHKVFLLVDFLSFQYLSGATIDYKEDVQGCQFIIKNPNATGVCGCGNSFDV